MACERLENKFFKLDFNTAREDVWIEFHRPFDVAGTDCVKPYASV